jgi:hypothetical protein
MEDKTMKTHANQTHYHLNAIAILVSITVLLLTLGIYKAITFSQKEAFRSYSTNTIATAPTSMAPELSEMLYSHSYNELVEEPALEIESWMTDYSTWITPSTTSSSMTDDSEETLEIESWMLNSDQWLETAPAPVSVPQFDPYEPKLEIESWMLNSAEWFETEDKSIESGQEMSIDVESWMLNIDEWFVPAIRADRLEALNQPVYEAEFALETWMYQIDSWIPQQENTLKGSDNTEFMQEESLPIESWMLDKTGWLS